MKIRQKVFLVAFIPSALATLALLTLAWHLSQQATLEHLRNESYAHLEVIRYQVSSCFTGIQAVLAAESRRLIPGEPESQLTEIIALEKRLGSTVDGIFLNLPDGQVLGTRGERFDTHDRYYYPLLREGTTLVTRILTSKASGQPSVIVLVPRMGENNEYLGALGASVPVSELLQTIRSYSPGKAGGALLVDDTGRIEASGIESETASRLIPLVDAAKKRYADIDLNGTPYHLVYTHIPGTSWKLALLIPYGSSWSMLQPQILTASALILLIILAIALVGYRLLKQLVSRPIEQLMVAHASLALGDRTVRIQTLGRDEFAALAASFNRMAEQLQRSEEELRHHEQIQASIAANIPGVIFRFFVRPDGSMELSFVGDRSLELLGIDAVPYETFLERLLERIMPEQRKPFLNSIRKAVQQKSPWSYEGFLLFPVGLSKWFHAQAQPTEIDTTLVFDGVLLDITERKQTEEALRRSEASLNAIMANTSDIIASYDRERRLVAYNKACVEAFRRLMGVEIHPGFRPFDTMPESTRAFWSKNSARVLAGESFTFEFEFPAADNKPLVFEASYHPIRQDNDIVGYSTTTRDITHRKRAEQALKENEEKYRELVQNANSIILRLDTRGNVTFFNEYAQRFFGYAEQDILGRSVVGTIVPEQESTGRDLRAMIQDICSQKGDFSFNENENTKHDGERVWISWTNRALRDDSGHLLGVLCVGTDITARKQTEAALRRSEAQVRTKLETILSPEGDLGVLELSDIIDIEVMQKIMTDFSAITHISVAIIDLRGMVLATGGWQDICTQFHRVHPATCRNCIESDTILADGVAPGAFKKYRCKNNMWDISTPIIVGGKHLGNLFLGQFLQEDETPDYSVFREQARLYGFDEEAYINALERVPRLNIKTIETVMNFYTQLASLISNLSYSTLQLARSLEAIKNTQAALRENEARFRSIIAVSHTGAWEYHRRTDYLWCSPEYFTMLGLDPEAFPMNGHANLQQTWLDLLHPDDRTQAGQHFSEYLDNNSVGMYEGYFRMRHTDGSWLWIWSRGQTLRHPDGSLSDITLGTHIDITQRKQAEQALAESELKFKTIYENAGDAIFLLDADTIIDCNNSSLALFGASREQIIGHNPLDYSPELQPDGRASAAKAAELYKAAYRGDPQIFEWTHHRFDKSCFFSEVNLSRIQISGKYHLQAILRDISERKKAEEEKDNLREQLAQAQKMESVGRLAGGVAHDFNNMLGVIIGHIELVWERIGQDSALRTSMNEVRKAAEHSADLTRQLLAFARKQTAKPKVLLLNEAVEGMLKILRRLIGEDIDLIWLPGNDIGSVSIDPSQVDQVLANLCINARDAIAGTGRLTIETHNAAFDEQYCAQHPEVTPGQYVLLTVSDNGCGMDRETIANIFEPFFTTKELGKGTGLGLSTVHGIVKQNNGFINVYSERGKGTTFRIYLPRCQPETASPLEEWSTITARQGNETILLVEDEPAILDITTLILQQLGYAVLPANTPDEAIRLAQKHTGKIDLIMSDVVMPEMNGRDLTLNLMSICPGIKSLFMSGYTADVIAHQGVLDTGVHFIQKPFTINEVAAKVREVLENN